MCPPLSAENFVSPSEENLHQRSTLFVEQSSSSTSARHADLHFTFSRARSSSRTDRTFPHGTEIDDEFDQISLSDTYFVSSIKSIAGRSFAMLTERERSVSINSFSLFCVP